MPNLNPYLTRFDQVPSLLSPELQGIFESSLHQTSNLMTRIANDNSAPKMVSGDDFWYAEDDWRASFRPYTVKDGILQIPVKGVLLHDFPYQLGGWATGYAYIWKAFERGMNDPEVQGIALICDTPGGEVAGNFDLVDKMFAYRGVKPIQGFAMESAYSAGYSIISVADKITVSRTGGVGSIGVVTMHVDVSKMMEEWGYKVTFIFAGKHKVDGNPYEALSSDVRERIQARIDELYGVFVSTVARNRGMDEQAIRDTEALTFTATQATSNGLADAIGSLDDAIAAFAVDLSLNEEDENMADFTQAQYDEGTSTARAEGLSAGRAEGRTEGANTMRSRIESVVASDEGKKRPAMAMKMAIGEKFAALDAETIIGMLGEMPEEKAETPASKPKGSTQQSTQDRFSARMDADGNVDLGVPADEEQAQKPSRAEKAVSMVKGVRKAA